MRNLLLAALGVFSLTFNASANDWARGMFTATSHDFGTVARAAKTEFRFEFENRSAQTIHVRSVRTSCGCTTPSVVTETVAPGGIGVILAKFNTHTHTGQRQATVTVTFDRPQFAEVQLLVKGYIRSDIVFNPGEAVFGTVNEGESKTIAIDLDYAGRSDWKVVSIGSNDEFVSAQIQEVTRAGGRIKYRIEATLGANAPVGPIQGELLLKTNDRNLTTVPIRLLANVQAPLAISPPLVALGEMKVGEPVRQMLILKGQQPFKIVEITSNDFEVGFEPISDAKNLHQLPVMLSPKPGLGSDIKGKIYVKTDLPGESTFSVDATCKIQE